MNIHHIKTPIGRLTLIAVEDRLVSIKFGKIHSHKSSDFLELVADQLCEYFTGERQQFDIDLAPKGTDFQKRAWNALLDIPYGKTKTYKEQALKLGGVNYTRAVGGANNKNPIPIIIPCHRVIGASGSLVGYAGGVKVKESLLQLEGVLL